MEALSKFDLLNLPVFILEHVHKIVVKQKGKLGMAYRYFLTKLFKHLEISLRAGTVGTMKQPFSMYTLVECECMEGRPGQLSKKSQLVVEKRQLKHELEEMTALVTKENAEIALLKAQLAKEQTEASGSAEVTKLRAKSESLLAQNAELTEKLIKAHDAANDHLTLVIQSLTQKPPFS
ncbi:hypothetical protein KY290_032516 [Solanum tuberosum]|uniref:Uncharacterized protein n=1 Tax=Solanum tuberosum TaxID=4113 RepID=A0ABQ7UCB6_SOLTU|nr:hypothetical protein KY284_031521 [Solanum tuberosum]KAH0744523.1 hypothetical protein KY290_032516 [Solanum tuberosum]